MKEGCCNEVFWVQKPGVLLTWGCNNSGCDTGQKQRRGGAATWNDATKILIVLSIVLLILKVSWWWILLVVGLLIIIFGYYNTHSEYNNCSCSSTEKGKNEEQEKSEVTIKSSKDIKEGFKDMSRDTKYKYPLAGRNTTSERGNMPKPTPSGAYNYVDDLSGEGKDTEYVLKGNGRRKGVSKAGQNEANRPKMTPKVIAPRDKKFRSPTTGGLDANRINIGDRNLDELTYETDIPLNPPPRDEIEGVDKMDKKYKMHIVTPSHIRDDPLQMYRDSILDEERDEVNNEIDRQHESSLSIVSGSFIYKS